MQINESPAIFYGDRSFESIPIIYKIKIYTSFAAIEYGIYPKETHHYAYVHYKQGDYIKYNNTRYCTENDMYKFQHIIEQENIKNLLDTL